MSAASSPSSSSGSSETSSSPSPVPEFEYQYQGGTQETEHGLVHGQLGAEQDTDADYTQTQNELFFDDDGQIENEIALQLEEAINGGDADGDADGENEGEEGGMTLGIDGEHDADGEMELELEGAVEGEGEGEVEEIDKQECQHLRALLRDDEDGAVFIKRFTMAVRKGLMTRHAAMGERPVKKRKIQSVSCGTCGDTLHRPLLCLDCSFAGCWPSGHMVAHLTDLQHGFCVDMNTGTIFCTICDDFIVNQRMETIRMEQIIALEEQATRFEEAKKGREPYKPWKANETELGQLKGTSTIACQGRKGLLNLGSSCYLNVVLQTLIHNPLLRAHFMSDSHNSKLCKVTPCICCEMDRLYTEIYSPNPGPFGPTSFLRTVYQILPDFASASQQDAHECFISILNQIHLNSRGRTSTSCVCVIHSTHAGELQSDVECGKCKNIKSQVDPMLDISLELRARGNGGKAGSAVNTEGETLQSCLKRYTQNEKLGPKEQVFCPVCNANSQDATRRLSIRKLPAVLCIQFKRFQQHTLTTQKNDIPVRFPATLNMTPYTSAALGRKDKKLSADMVGPDALYEYELFAVVNHEGQMDSGHYTNFARFQDEWYRFDDDKVYPSTLGACLDSRGAYMCVYVKKHLEYRPYQRPSYIVKREEEKEKENQLGLSQQQNGGKASRSADV